MSNVSILKPGDKLSNIYGLLMSPALMASEPVHLGKACCHSESCKDKSLTQCLPSTSQANEIKKFRTK